MSTSATFEQIKIVKIIKKEQRPSSYKRGGTFAVVIFRDEKNRKIKAMGKWTNELKEDKTIDGLLKRSSYNNDWGTKTVSYYVEKMKKEYDGDEMIRLYRLGAVSIKDLGEELAELL